MRRPRKAAKEIALAETAAGRSAGAATRFDPRERDWRGSGRFPRPVRTRKRRFRAGRARRPAPCSAWTGDRDFRERDVRASLGLGRRRQKPNGRPPSGHPGPRLSVWRDAVTSSIRTASAGRPDQLQRPSTMSNDRKSHQGADAPRRTFEADRWPRSMSQPCLPAPTSRATTAREIAPVFPPAKSQAPVRPPRSPRAQARRAP